MTVYFGLSDDEGQLFEVSTDRPPVVGEAVILPGPGGESRAYEVAEAVTVVLSGGLARDAAAQTVFLLRPQEGRPPRWAERFHAGLG